jgi:type IV pilus assembly protein PilQ
MLSFKSKSSSPADANKSLRHAVCAFALFSAGALQLALAESTNRLEGIQTQVLAGNKIELTLQLAEAAPTPLLFTVDNPARIALDLPATAVAMSSRRLDIKQGVLDTVNVAEANGRTRVVLNVDNLVPYETRVQGNNILVTLAAAGATAASISAPPPAAVLADVINPRKSNPTPKVGGKRNVNKIDFRRGSDGSGRVIVELTDAKVPADLKQEGGKLVVSFSNTTVGDNLLQRLDVADFATPVNTVDTLRVGDNTRVVITATGDYEQLAYQSDNIYTIEIKPVVKRAPNVQDKKEYVGERLTLNFQDIETRAVLQLLADSSGQNMVISDTVGGAVTLRLQSVPWDQALDIILRTKGLDSRTDGNVIFIAPVAEIAAREKELLSARKETQELAPLRSEFLQINYAKAGDLAALIKSGNNNSLLSERGSVTIDERTNTLLLQDTSDRLSDIRRLVATLDIAVRQVRIEARIVIVNDDFSRALGVRFGVNGTTTGVGGSDGQGFFSNRGLDAPDGTGLFPGANDPRGPLAIGSADNRYAVNLPIANPAGSFALSFLDSDFIVDLELTAAQAEGRGEILSQPTLITANQREATIEQGVEIPFQEASSSGATTTQFKKAVLALKVTPQITPDNRVILDLAISKDSIGQLVASATGGFVPSIDTREIVTQVLVNDGQTVVLGGIFETERRDSENKVPVLGDVPVLGRLFKSTTKMDNKDELLIFVTPRILKEGSNLY